METTSITVPARDLDIGDAINGAIICQIRHGPGVVYVWVDDNDRPAADMIFNHGDPVRIDRTDSYATHGCHCGDDVHDCR